MSFFVELKRRHVYKVAIAYLVAAWLLLQVGAIVFPAFGAPAWALRVLLGFLALGFPIAILLAWAFEITPDGVRRTESATSANARPSRHTHRMGRYLNASIIVVLLTAVSVLGWRQFATVDRASPSVDGTAAGAPVTLAGISAKSVAVLPFENLSTDKNNAYFADGMQDTILTTLARIGALKVISRTSTQQYRSRPGNLSRIAQQLAVASVLEGSVQKVGDQVLINVQLIDTRTNMHVWAGSYHRTLADVFGVEGEVAEKVAAALQARLTGVEQQTLAARLTDNPAAYDAYLHGLAGAARASTSPAHLRGTVRFFTQAVELDPGFALAWAHLSVAHSELYFLAVDPAPRRLAQAKRAAAMALKLAPELGEAWLSEGYYHYWGLKDYAGALDAFYAARTRLPNNAEVLAAISYVERRQGYWQAALAHQQQAFRLDPRNTRLLYQWAQTYIALRRFAQARSVLDRSLKLTPHAAQTIALKATTYQAEGGLDAAGKLLRTLPSTPGNPYVFPIQMSQLLYRRNYPAAIEGLETALSTAALDDVAGDYGVMLGLAQQRAGDVKAARITYQRGRTALQALRKAGDTSLYLTIDLGDIEAGLGHAKAARREGQSALRLAERDVLNKPFAQANLARIEAQLGNADAALALLPRLLRVPYPDPLTPALLRLDPAWDRIRQDPRFQKLVAGATSPPEPQL